MEGCMYTPSLRKLLFGGRELNDAVVGVRRAGRSQEIATRVPHARHDLLRYAFSENPKNFVQMAQSIMQAHGGARAKSCLSQTAALLAEQTIT
jgi:hypothetical protein